MVPYGTIGFSPRITVRQAPGVKIELIDAFEFKYTSGVGGYYPRDTAAPIATAMDLDPEIWILSYSRYSASSLSFATSVQVTKDCNEPQHLTGSPDGPPLRY